MPGVDNLQRRPVISPAMKPMHSLRDMSDAQWQTACHLFQKQAEGDVLMVQYAVYKHPTDAPNHYMVRRWEVLQNGRLRDCEAYGYKTLEDARTCIPQWATRLPHQRGEDAKICETWF